MKKKKETPNLDKLTPRERADIEKAVTWFIKAYQEEESKGDVK